jgi:YVTN family beta-propeller protein
VAVGPFGARLYVANYNDNTVSVLNALNGKTLATVPVGTAPQSEAVSMDGTRVYVANIDSANTSVISTGNDKVTTTVAVGNSPAAVATQPGCP